MRSKNIVTVSTSDDAHVNYIAPILKKRGAHIFRIDGDVISSQMIYHSFNSKQILDLENSEVVWYRKVILPDRYDSTSQFIRQETEGLLNALLLELESCRWVNNRWSIERARSKLHQLKLAQGFGFRVPESLLTNQGHLLEEFFDRHNGSVVVKPIQTQIIETPRTALVLGTRRLTKEAIPASAKFFPCLAQERLNLKHEIRVIVFRDQMFGFTLKSKKQVDDLKQLKLTEIEHGVCMVDSELQSKISHCMAYYGLEFGAFDFGVVDDREPYFF